MKDSANTKCALFAGAYPMPIDACREDASFLAGSPDGARNRMHVRPATLSAAWRLVEHAVCSRRSLEHQHATGLAPLSLSSSSGAPGRRPAIK